MRIGTKLGIGFGLILLMVVALSALVVTKLSGMDQDVARIEADLANKVRVSSINAAVKDNAVSSMEMLLNTDTAVNAKIIARMEERNKSNAALLETLGRDLTGSEQDQKLLAEMKKHRSLYVSGLERVVAMIKDGKREEATYVAGEEMIPMLTPFLNAVKNLESGRGASVRSLLHVLRALDREDWIQALAPQVSISPLQVLKRRPVRQRATRSTPTPTRKM